MAKRGQYKYLNENGILMGCFRIDLLERVTKKYYDEKGILKEEKSLSSNIQMY
jgi:hypothetical protein